MTAKCSDSRGPCPRFIVLLFGFFLKVSDFLLVAVFERFTPLVAHLTLLLLSLHHRADSLLLLPESHITFEILDLSIRLIRLFYLRGHLIIQLLLLPLFFKPLLIKLTSIGDLFLCLMVSITLVIPTLVTFGSLTFLESLHVLTLAILITHQVSPIFLHLLLSTCSCLILVSHDSGPLITASSSHLRIRALRAVPDRRR